MTAQFQYTTLPHQTAAVQSLADVLADVRFVPPANVHANPSYVPREAAPTLKANLAAVWPCCPASSPTAKAATSTSTKFFW